MNQVQQLACTFLHSFNKAQQENTVCFRTTDSELGHDKPNNVQHTLKTSFCKSQSYDDNQILLAFLIITLQNLIICKSVIIDSAEIFRAKSRCEDTFLRQNIGCALQQEKQSCCSCYVYYKVHATKVLPEHKLKWFYLNFPNWEAHFLT